MSTYRFQRLRLTSLMASKICRGFKAATKTKRSQLSHEKKHFRSCKTRSKEGKAVVFRAKIERSYISLISLEIKKEKTKNDALFLMINCRT